MTSSLNKCHKQGTEMLCCVSDPSGEQTFLYLCWYLIMSLLGHYNNFFFACHLLDIAMGVKTLRTILSSVTHNGTQVGARQSGRSSGRDTSGLLTLGFLIRRTEGQSTTFGTLTKVAACHLGD